MFLGSALFVKNRLKLGRRFVPPLHFLFGPFWLIGQFATPVTVSRWLPGTACIANNDLPVPDP
jgi:hypothetical protein